MFASSQILYIDDEAENLLGFHASMSRDFNIITAENVESAYKILKTYSDIGVILIDFKMPNEDEIEFVSKIKEEFLDVIFILTSAWVDLEFVVKTVDMNLFYGFIQKPWNHEEIKITLKNALHLYDSKIEIRSLQATIIDKNKELEKSIERETNGAKNIFLQNISHEIRTPLNSIIGFSSLIKQNCSEKKLTTYSDIIITSSYELLRTIHNILEASVIVKNQINIKKSKFNFRNVVQRILNKNVQLAKSKQLKIISYIDNDLEIVNDELKTQNILDTLVNNAIKFTEKGTITIECSESNYSITTKVTDTGIGIASEVINQIFEPFHQLDETSTRKQGGSGIGLFIAKSYVEFLGGELWVESTPNIGSSFSFSLKKLL